MKHLHRSPLLGVFFAAIAGGTSLDLVGICDRSWVVEVNLTENTYTDRELNPTSDIYTAQAEVFSDQEASAYVKTSVNLQNVDARTGLLQ